MNKENGNEIKRLIHMALNPSGDPVNLREREQAARNLLEHGNEAHDALMVMLLDKPESLEAPRIVELIGRFKKDESVDVLKKLLMQCGPVTCRPAGISLALINTNAANEALKQALLSDNREVRIAAIDGVRLSGNKTWCALLSSSLQDQDANLRYYAVNTAAALGCLDVRHLKNIIEGDADEHVRQLASTWLGKTC